MIDTPKLTSRQQQILELIQSAIARTGAPPTRAEIAASQSAPHGPEAVYPGLCRGLSAAARSRGVRRSAGRLSGALSASGIRRRTLPISL